jgi:hypothetical protein
MAYIVSDFLPGATEKEYKDEVAIVHPQGQLPKGQIYHAAGQSDGGVLIVTVWDSKESADRFIAEALTPLASKSNDLRVERQRIGAIGFNIKTQG